MLKRDSLTTPGRLNRLVSRSADAQSRLIDVVQEAAVRQGDWIAWGQFLDAPRNTSQYGIYGTSAAIQMLSMAGFSKDSAFVQKARSRLPDSTAGAANSKYDLSDLAVTFKLAALLEATEPGAEEFSKVSKTEKRLLGQMLDGRGWGNYSDDASQDEAPRLLPTVVALQALRRSRAFRGSRECDTILMWICSTVGHGVQVPIYQAAMALIALRQYHDAGMRTPDYPAACRTLQKSCSSWASERRADDLGEIVAYHYWAITSGQQHNHYVYYSPDLLVAYALLNSQNPPRGRDFVIRVVRSVCDSIEHSGGLAAKASGRIATVDQLWAYRVLSAFRNAHSSNARVLLPRGIYAVSATPARRWTASVVLFIIGVAAAVGGLLDKWPTWIQGAAWSLSTLTIGLLAALIVFWRSSDE